jgi:hypothetical protein
MIPSTTEARRSYQPNATVLLQPIREQVFLEPVQKWDNLVEREQTERIWLSYVAEGTEISRIALTCCFAALLGSCTQGVPQVDWERARLACADVGLAPGTTIFDNCVFDLYYTLWNEQNAWER